jgi:hypothetical protein
MMRTLSLAEKMNQPRDRFNVDGRFGRMMIGHLPAG